MNEYCLSLIAINFFWIHVEFKDMSYFSTPWRFDLITFDMK
jgi:hypothetical protein